MSAAAISSFPLDDTGGEKYHEGRKPFPSAKSLESKLPEWRIVTLEVGVEAGAYVTCPRCGYTAGVSLQPWLELKKEFVGRPCTYCFKTAKIPEALRVPR